MDIDRTKEARALRLIRLAGDLIDRHLCKIGDGRPDLAYPDTLYEVVESLCNLALTHLSNNKKDRIH